MNLKDTIRRILREESEKKPRHKMEKLIEEMGLMSLIHSIGLDNLMDILEMTKEELFQKYNPFKKIFSDEEFNTEFYDTIKFFSRPTFYDTIKKKSSEETLDFIISGIIDSFHDRLINFDTEDWIIPNTPKLLKMIYGDRIKNDPKYIKMVYLAKNLHEDSSFKIIKRLLKEDFTEERKQRVMDKIINILTTSIYVKEKSNELVFWFISDQINEPIFKYNKRKKILKVLKGKVKNFLDVYLPESFGDEFRKDILTTVFNNLTFNTLTLNSIIYEQ